MNWIIIGIISLGVGVTLEITDVTFNFQQIPLVFSSISTGLAAIFALVFAIITVSIQITKRYNAIDLFFGKSTIILMLIFSVTIILPLLNLMLEIRLYPKLMISLFTFCILSLIPFLKNINSKLQFEVGLQNLKEEIFEVMDLGNDASTANKIRDLTLIGSKTIRQNLTDKTNLIIGSLSDMSVSAREKKLKVTTEVIGIGFINLICSTDKKKDDKIISDLLTELKYHFGYCIHEDIEYQYSIEKHQQLLEQLGIKFIDNEFNEKLIQQIMELYFSILESSHEHFYGIKKNSIIILGELCRESFKKKLTKSGEYSVLYLWYSSANMLNWYNKILNSSQRISKKPQRIFDILKTAINVLYEIENLIGTDEFDRLFNETKDYNTFTAWPGVFYWPSIKKFRTEYYEKYKLDD